LLVKVPLPTPDFLLTGAVRDLDRNQSDNHSRRDRKYLRTILVS
jgi:hypothetical protein